MLVFTLAQGLFWAGVVATFVMGLGTAIMVAAIAVLSVMATSWAERIASTRGGYGMLFMRGLEVAAALLITAFGTLLLMGYMASERLLACWLDQRFSRRSAASRLTPRSDTAGRSPSDRRRPVARC